MAETILSENQRKVLEAVSMDPMVCENFHLIEGLSSSEGFLFKI